MKWLVVLLIVLIFATASAHENSGMVHTEGGIGPCYGWKTVDSNQRICYTNKEQTLYKVLIYNHGLWHESEEMGYEVFENPDELTN